MGKRKKKEVVSLNGSPLQAITIGEIKKSKYGWLGSIFLILFFCALIYFLPDINEWYLQYKQGAQTPIQEPPGNITNTTTPPTTEDELQYDIYSLEESPTIVISKINFYDFERIEEVFGYTIKNNNTEEIILDDYNIFIEVYAEDEEVLQRFFINGTLDAGARTFHNVSIDPDMATDFAVYVIPQENYTYIDLEIDENKMSELVCKKGTQTITYTFSDGQLTLIEDDLRYSKSNEDYDATYAYYSNLVNDYDNIEGITTEINSNDLRLSYKMEIDYNIYEERVNSSEYFVGKTDPREVNFKMEAMGYDCK